jgi:hypothetical protein
MMDSFFAGAWPERFPPLRLARTFFGLDLFVAAGANLIEHCVIGALVCRKSDQGRQIRNLREIIHVSTYYA